MSDSMLRFRSRVIGTHLGNKETTLTEPHGAAKYSSNITVEELELCTLVGSLTENAIDVYKDTFMNELKVASITQMKERYTQHNKAFSILDPCRARTTLRISHGSHR